MTPHYVLDSFALLSFFRNEPGAEKVKQLLLQAASDKCELWLCVVNAGEVYYMSKRKDGAAQAAAVWQALQQFPLHWVEVDQTLALEAAGIKADYCLSYADAMAAAICIRKKATLVTGNPEFDNLKSLKGFRVAYL